MPQKLRELIFDSTITIRTTNNMTDTIDDIASREHRTLSSMTKILISEALSVRAKETSSFKWDDGQL